MSIGRMPQSVKLLLAMGKATTDVNGLADVVIQVPGAFGLDSEGNLLTYRTIEGGFSWFKNQEPGDWVTIELRDDDNLLGTGAGAVIDTFDDKDVPSVNQGWFLLNDGPMELHPIVSDDPTELPGGFYLHICGHKANIATADELFVNLHWGKRLR